MGRLSEQFGYLFDEGFPEQVRRITESGLLKRTKPNHRNFVYKLPRLFSPKKLSKKRSVLRTSIEGVPTTFYRQELVVRANNGRGNITAQGYRVETLRQLDNIIKNLVQNNIPITYASLCLDKHAASCYVCDVKENKAMCDIEK